jgi:methylmalonyl-CoA mutase cobalamin-binding domain/chain
MSSEILNGIVRAISELYDSEKLRDLINQAISQGVPVKKIIEDGIRKGLEDVGKKFEEGEYFLAELLFAAELVQGCFEVLKPHLKSIEIGKRGVIVLGTVKGDIHDIGKNVFKMLAESEGFEVYDLGVNVSPEEFIKKIKETSAKILGLSALLTTTMEEMKTVIDELVKAGLRNKIKVLLGGNPVTKEFAKEIGADDAAMNAIEGVEICKRWVSQYE